MRIFVAGSTGVLGRRVVPRLTAAGHSVTAISRSSRADSALISAGAVPAHVDLFDATALRQAVANCEAVVNLATHIPPSSTAFKRQAWVENDRIRTAGSRNLADAARAAGASLFVQESITLSYADCGDRWIDESVSLIPAWNTASALEAERNAQTLVSSAMTVVVLRFATLYAPEADYTRLLAGYLRKGQAPLIGRLEGYVSMLHADDAAAAICAALRAPTCVYNVAENEPVTRGVLLDALAKMAGYKRLRRLPNWLVRLVGGEVAELLMRSQRVSNAAFREATDWKPEFGSSQTGLPFVLTSMN